MGQEQAHEAAAAAATAAQNQAATPGVAEATIATQPEETAMEQTAEVAAGELREMPESPLQPAEGGRGEEASAARSASTGAAPPPAEDGEDGAGVDKGGAGAENCRACVRGRAARACSFRSSSSCV